MVGASFQPVSNDSYYSDPDGAPSGYTSKLNLKEENEMIFWLNVPKSGTQVSTQIQQTLSFLRFFSLFFSPFIKFLYQTGNW